MSSNSYFRLHKILMLSFPKFGFVLLVNLSFLEMKKIWELHFLLLLEQKHIKQFRITILLLFSICNISNFNLDKIDFEQKKTYYNFQREWLTLIFVVLNLNKNYFKSYQIEIWFCKCSLVIWYLKVTPQ